MPINYKDYPKNWKWLSRQIIKDAGNRCELCFAPNGILVERDKTRKYPWYEYDISTSENKPTKIILTVHHIDSNKINSKKQNLIALCQRCHLRLDLQKHMKNRAESRRLQAIGE